MGRYAVYISMSLLGLGRLVQRHRITCSGTCEENDILWASIPFQERTTASRDIGVLEMGELYIPDFSISRFEPTGLKTGMRKPLLKLERAKISTQI